MSKFTPGPWEWVDDVVVAKPIDTIVMVKLDEEAEGRPHHTGLTALVYGHCVVDGEYTRDGNARLIAAAPEMYEALCQVAHHADDECGFMVDVRRVLARIDGEQP